MSRGRQFLPKDQQRWLLFESWLLILSVSIINPPAQDQQRWSPFHMKVKVDCWSSPCQLSTCPPGSTETIAFSNKSESWLLILSTSIIDPPTQDQQRWLPFHMKVTVDCWSSPRWSSTHPPGSTVLITSVLIVDRLCVDCRSTPPTDFDCLIFNIRILFSSACANKTYVVIFKKNYFQNVYPEQSSSHFSKNSTCFEMEIIFKMNLSLPQFNFNTFFHRISGPGKFMSGTIKHLFSIGIDKVITKKPPHNTGQIPWLQSLPTVCVYSITNTLPFWAFSLHSENHFYHTMDRKFVVNQEFFLCDLLGKLHLYSYHQTPIPRVSASEPSHWFISHCLV